MALVWAPRWELSFNRSCSDCNNAVTRESDTDTSKTVNHEDGERCMKRIAGSFLAALALALTVVVLAHAALSINGAGASFPYPMYSKWFDEYRKKNPSIEINYQSIGSG